MSPLDRLSRERGQSKQRARAWGNLCNRRTLKFLMVAGPMLARLLELIVELIKCFRE